MRKNFSFSFFSFDREDKADQNKESGGKKDISVHLVQAKSQDRTDSAEREGEGSNSLFRGTDMERMLRFLLFKFHKISPKFKFCRPNSQYLESK